MTAAVNLIRLIVFMAARRLVYHIMGSCPLGPFGGTTLTVEPFVFLLGLLRQRSREVDGNAAFSPGSALAHVPLCCVKHCCLLFVFHLHGETCFWSSRRVPPTRRCLQYTVHIMVPLVPFGALARARTLKPVPQSPSSCCAALFLNSGTVSLAMSTCPGTFALVSRGDSRSYASWTKGTPMTPSTASMESSSLAVSFASRYDVFFFLPQYPMVCFCSL